MGDSNGEAAEKMQKSSHGNPFPSEDAVRKIMQKSKDCAIDYQLYTSAHQQFDWEFLKAMARDSFY
jgi:hypothetical protein